MAAMLASYPPHVRRVIVLAALAGALTAMAIVGVITTRQPTAQVFKPQPYFPNLATRIADVRHIHIQDKSHAAELTYAPETGWVVSDKDGYHARYDKIQQLFRSLIELERFDKKTANAKWHKRLLLTDPRQKGGEATLVQLLGASDKPIAEILIGLNADVDAASGKQQIYVRAPGNDQVWLARGEGLSDLLGDGGDWLDTTIIDVPKNRIARGDIAPQGAPPYAVVHASPDAENFAVESMPAGMKLKAETSANGVGTLLSDLGLRDVASADRITFAPNAPSATYQTFNGLKIRVEATKLGNDTWVRLIPSATDKADAQAKAEASDLTRRLTPWVFQIESWKASQMDTKLDSLIEPVNAPAKQTNTKPESGHTDNTAPQASAAADSSMAPAPSHSVDKKTGTHSTPAKKPGAKAPAGKTAPKSTGPG